MKELLRLRESQDELDQATFDASTHQAVAEVVVLPGCWNSRTIPDGHLLHPGKSLKLGPYRQAPLKLA